MERHTVLLAGLAATVLLLALQGVQTQMHTQVESMSDSCDAQLKYLWGNYTNPPVAPVAGCDVDCLAACYTTLDWAIYSEKMQNCPKQEDIIRCMHVYRAKWLTFVNQCALFQYGVSTSAEAEGEAGSSSSSTTSSAEAEGEASTSTAEAEGEASTTTAEAEGEASTTTAEAEGEAGEGARRRLLQEAEAEGEGGSGVYNGCFPTFQSYADFLAYIDGEFVFKTSSDAVGITLSVLFFTTLLLMGLGMPKSLKAKLAPVKASIKAKLCGCCGRRTRAAPGPTKLPAPATMPPAAEAVAAVDAPPAAATAS